MHKFEHSPPKETPATMMNYGESSSSSYEDVTKSSSSTPLPSFLRGVNKVNSAALLLLSSGGTTRRTNKKENKNKTKHHHHEEQRLQERRRCTLHCDVKALKHEDDYHCDAILYREKDRDDRMVVLGRGVASPGGEEMPCKTASEVYDEVYEVILSSLHDEEPSWWEKIDTKDFLCKGNKTTAHEEGSTTTRIMTRKVQHRELLKDDASLLYKTMNTMRNESYLFDSFSSVEEEDEEEPYIIDFLKERAGFVTHASSHRPQSSLTIVEK